MIQVRVVFQAKFGQGGALVAALAESLRRMADGRTLKIRLLTDLSGDFDNVAMESEYESLAAWEHARGELFADPLWQEGAAAFYDLIASGRQQYWTIEAEL